MRGSYERSLPVTGLDTFDHERAAFIRRYFGKEWPNSYLYDLMINSKTGDELLVRTILERVAALDAAALPC